MANSQFSKITNNLIWAVAGKVTNLLSSLLVGILVARYLGPEKYGIMTYVISFVMMFQVLASFGLENIEIREEAKREDDRNTILGTAFILRVIFAILAIIIINIITIYSEHDYFTRWMILIYSSTLLLNSFQVIRNYFTSIVWNEYIVKSEMTRTIIGAVVKIGLLLLKMDLEWFIVACVFDGILVTSGYIISYNKVAGSITNWRINFEEAKYLVIQAFPLMISLSAVLVYEKIDQLMLAKMLNNEELGYYSVATKFTDLIIFLPTIMAQTISPILVRTYKNDLTEYKKKATLFINITVWMCIIASIITAILSPLLINITFGKQYSPAIPILQILVFKSIGSAMSSSAGQMIIIQNIQKWGWIRNILACFVCVGLNYFFIPKYGVIGSAISSIITILFAGTFSNILIPPYWFVIKAELTALFLGWKDLVKIKHIMK